MIAGVEFRADWLLRWLVDNCDGELDLLAFLVSVTLGLSSALPRATRRAPGSDRSAQIRIRSLVDFSGSPTCSRSCSRSCRP